MRKEIILKIASYTYLYKRVLITSFFVFCFLLSCYLLFYHLGKYPLENWDEAFYGQATKEMLQTKDFIALHWDYRLWLDKPPMFIWITSIFFSIFGYTELSLRIPSALSALGILLGVMVYVYRKYSLVPAFLAFFTLLLNNVFIWRARSGNIDLFVSLLIFASFFLLLSNKWYKYILLGFIYASIYLTKASLVLFPLLIFFLHELIFMRQNIKQNWKNYLLLLGILLGITGLWLFLGYKEEGMQFVRYFLFQSDQGVATFAKFNPNYILHTYYSLQRRFFWLFLLGIVLATWKINKREYFLLVLYGVFLILQLSFTTRDNNWYLIPSMPFWSIAIGFAVYFIERMFKKGGRVLYTIVICGLLIVSTYLFYKTYSVNILPILDSSSTISQEQSAKKIMQLTKHEDIIVRLDPLIPTTLYYDKRKTLAYDANTNTQGYWINNQDLSYAIKSGKIKWLVGTNEDVNVFFNYFNISKFQQMRVNSQEIILKVR